MAFLHSCVRERLPLKSLRRKPMVDSVECQQAIHQFQQKTIRALINDQHRRVRALKQWAYDCRRQCDIKLSGHHLQVLANHIEEMEKRTRRETTTRLQCKINALREFKYNNCAIDGLVRNLSSKVLTHAQLSLLQRDVGHNLMDANALDFITALEPVMYRMGADEETKSSIRQQVTGLLTSHRYQRTLSKEEAIALGQLKRDDSIVILPADKGRMTVVMDKTLYITKALDLLSDRTAYRVIEKDPSVMLRNKTNKLLDNLKRSNKIGDDTLRRIRPRDTALARFYGLPKIHKEGIPLRPIVSLVGTPISGLAKWLSGRLCHLVEGSPTMIKSAEEFLGRIKTLRLEEDEKMVSFDVTSLFTSIPQDLAISALGERLTNMEGSYHQDSLHKDDLLRLVRICLTTYFTFQGTIFEQTKGTPMGSPISSIIAEVVLQQLEHKAMAIYQPKFWVRYVDDTFAVVKKQHVATFMGTLNSIWPDIQFTVEEEQQGHLAFLDVSIHRQPDGRLHTGVFRKSTYTDKILHYESNHPVSHKASCIKTLFKRVDSHCSTEELKREERKYLYRICQRNGYPWRFIRQHSTRSHLQKNQRRDEPPLQKTRIALPYIHNVSEATARLLAPYGVEIAHKPTQTLRSKVVRPKDPLMTMDKSAVIYKIECKNCNGNYVGETSKRLGTRIHEHKLAIKRGEQRSQLWTHMAQLNHQFDFVNTRIMSEENTKEGRLLKEAWYSDKDSINRHVDLHPAQLALRKWDSNPPRNRHKCPAQCPFNHDREAIPAPSHEQGHENCTNSQYTKDTPISWSQHQCHLRKQREHLSASGNHPPVWVPPQYPHDESLPLEDDSNYGESDGTNKRRLRSATTTYDDHKKGGEEETKRNEGKTWRIAHTRRGREMTCRLNQLPTMGTIVGDPTYTPLNKDSGAIVNSTKDQPLLGTIERGGAKKTEGREGGGEGDMQVRARRREGYPRVTCKNVCNRRKGDGEEVKEKETKRNGGITQGTMACCLDPSSPKHTTNSDSPPRNGDSKAAVNGRNDQPLLTATGIGGETGDGGEEQGEAQRRAIHQGAICKNIRSRRKGDREGIGVTTRSRHKLVEQRKEIKLGNMNEGGKSPDTHTYITSVNGTPNEKRGEGWDTGGSCLDGEAVMDPPGVDCGKDNRMRSDIKKGGEKKDPDGTGNDGGIMKGTTRRYTERSEETSRIRTDRPGPVTRSMSRVQMSVKPI